MITPSNILQKIPHQPPFRFIDAISEMTTEQFSGSYTFKPDEYFFKGHYPERPIVPGFILNECMVQIGLVAFGIYLLEAAQKPIGMLPPVLCDAKCDYLVPVYPGDTIFVTSTKIYFRLNKLRCNIAAFNQHEQKVCEGIFSGIAASI
jgi:3-hydroxyacyl-[acyl-carrier-protein] dehydratase